MASDDEVRQVARRHLFAVRTERGVVVVRGHADVHRVLGFDPRDVLADDTAALRVAEVIGEEADELRRRAVHAYGGAR